MNNKTPLFHITRRLDIPFSRAIVIRVIAIILAFALCGIVTTVLTGENPFDVYSSIFNGAFGSSRKIWVTGQNTAILLLVALALAPAFRMKFWNLGGDGQVLIGCTASAAVLIYLADFMPSWLLTITAGIAAVVAGAIWGFIPAFFKAKWNTNETLFTLMMNYVATQLAAFCIVSWAKTGSGTLGILNQNTEAGWLPQLGNKYLLIILVALVITVLMFIYMRYTKQGYEISVVGESERTARYIGIKVDRVIIRTMIISGALCGLTGYLLVCGNDHTLTTSLVNGRGFTAVIVAWLAKFNPFVMIITSLLIAFLDRGSNQITTSLGLNSAFGDILTGIILFFIIGCEFFINYKITFRKSEKKEVA